MVVNNYTLLGEAARHNFDDAFGPDVLRIGPMSSTKAGAILHNDKYQFEFNHAFDGFDKYVSHYRRDTLLTEKSFKLYYHLIKNKFEHLTNNSRMAFSTTDKTLYIAYAVSWLAKPAGQRHQDFLSLLNIIKSK